MSRSSASIISRPQMAVEICPCPKCGCGSSTAQFIKPDALLAPILDELSTGRMLNDRESEALEWEGHTLSGEIRRIDARITRTQSALTNLQSLKDEWELAVMRCRTFLSPIWRVPRELWMNIFILAIDKDAEMRQKWVEGDKKTGDKSPWRISQVCRYWRDVTLALPELWVYFDITLPYSEKMTEYQLELQLQRSHPNNISIRLSFEESLMRQYYLRHGDFPLIWRCLLRHCDRWDTVYLNNDLHDNRVFVDDLPWGTARGPIERHLFHGYPFHRVRSLALQRNNGVGELLLATPAVVTLTCTYPGPDMGLTTLAKFRSPIRSPICSLNLTENRCDPYEQNQNIHYMLDFLEVISGTLQHLTVPGRGICGVELLPGRTIVLPMLLSLHVEKTRVHIVGKVLLDPSLHSLIAPQLKSLIVEDPTPWVQVSVFLGRAQCYLKTLHLALPFDRYSTLRFANSSPTSDLVGFKSALNDGLLSMVTNLHIYGQEKFADVACLTILRRPSSSYSSLSLNDVHSLFQKVKALELEHEIEMDAYATGQAGESHCPSDAYKPNEWKPKGGFAWEEGRWPSEFMMLPWNSKEELERLRVLGEQFDIFES